MALPQNNLSVLAIGTLLYNVILDELQIYTDKGLKNISEHEEYYTPTPTIGKITYNSFLNKLQIYSATGWGNIPAPVWLIRRIKALHSTMDVQCSNGTWTYSQYTQTLSDETVRIYKEWLNENPSIS